MHSTKPHQTISTYAISMSSHALGPLWPHTTCNQCSTMQMHVHTPGIHAINASHTTAASGKQPSQAATTRVRLPNYPHGLEGLRAHPYPTIHRPEGTQPPPHQQRDPPTQLSKQPGGTRHACLPNYLNGLEGLSHLSGTHTIHAYNIPMSCVPYTITNACIMLMP